jgi:transcriptional regulator with XRE-family HTH domain
MSRKIGTGKKREPKKRMDKSARLAVFTRLVQALDSIREHQGLSDPEIANEIEVSRTLLSKWRGGATDPVGAPLPTSDVLSAFCVRFDVSAEWLLTGHGPANRSALMVNGAIESTLAERVEVAVSQRIRDEGIHARRVHVDGERLIEWLVDRGVEEARAIANYDHYQDALAIAQQMHDYARGGEKAGPLLLTYARGKAVERLAYGPGEMGRPDTSVLHWESTSITNPTR